MTIGASPSDMSSTRSTLGCDTRLGEHEPLLLTTGQRASQLVEAHLELGEQRHPRSRYQRGCRPSTGCTSTPAGCRPPTAREAACDLRRPPRCRRRAPCRGAVGDVDTVDRHGPTGGAQQPATPSARLDLPAPFGPRIAVTSPSGAVIETSRTTVCPPRRPRPDRSRDRSLEILLAEVGLEHLGIAEHIVGRTRRQQPSEVEHGGPLAARPDEAHVVLRRARPSPPPRGSR